MKTFYIIQLFVLAIISSCNGEEKIPDTKEPIASAETLNISYGSDPNQTFDLYLPTKKTIKPTKTLILIHGGGWSGGDKIDMLGILTAIRRDLPEYAVVNMNYRLSTAQNPAFPMQTDDIASVIAKLKKDNYKLSNNIGLVGISAGGHLSMLYGYGFNASRSIKMVASIVGPTNFTDDNYLTNGENALFRPILGGTYNDIPEVYKQNSPLLRATAKAPPTLLLYGNTDLLVPTSQGQDMTNKLTQLGVYNEFKFYNGGHLTWSLQDFNDAETRLINFIKKKF